MPPRVYRGRYGFEFHPKSGGSKTLCKLDATEAQVWTAYRKTVSQGVRDVSWLANEYLSSPNYLRLKPNTQRTYEECWKKLRPVFGHVDAINVKHHHIRRYMDERGKISESRANKEKRFFSNVFAYGFERGLVQFNPCDGVKQFLEKPRDRYVTDEEYYAFLKAAPPIVQIFMELSYITASRGQDVRKIALNDITEDGLYVEQLKTGKKQMNSWNERVQAVVKKAREIRAERLAIHKVESMYLIVTESGGPYTDSGLLSMWRRARETYFEETGIKINWTFHDLKAKAISDFKGDKQKFSGHKTRSMMERYNRTADIVDAIDFSQKEE